MANSITKFKKYIDLLDEVYKNAATSSVLDGDNTLVRAGANTNEIIIPKISMDGLADYSRSSGYVSGDVTLTNETVSFNYDRGRRFSVDAMDNEETAGIAFGKLSSEFLRTKVAPELDAFRYAQYAQTSGISTVAGATLGTGETALAALIAAQNTLDEAEVSPESRYLFVVPTIYNLIMNIDTTKSKAVLSSFAGIIKVPQARFYTKIDLYDGTTNGQTAGGYIKNAASGKDINFLIVEKSAALQYTKHNVNKVITPEENQTGKDGWIFDFRSYGLTDVYDNKVAGIYLHKKA